MSLFGYALVKQTAISWMEKEIKKLEVDLAQAREMQMPSFVYQKTDEAKEEIEKLQAEVQEYKKKYLDEFQKRLELAKLMEVEPYEPMEKCKNGTPERKL